jgi:pyridoxamine 5'-phosphate oxidase
MDPIAEFRRWYAEAAAVPGYEADPVALATATRDGRPSVRIVLYRGLSGGGFRFFTHYDSRKGQELAENPRAALCFHFRPQERQVRIEGPVERLSEEESDMYFHNRPRESQLSAAVSPQSRAIHSLAELEADREKLAHELGLRDVPRPADWGGYRVIPQTIELWVSGPNRMHERRFFHHDRGVWRMTLLAP